MWVGEDLARVWVWHHQQNLKIEKLGKANEENVKNIAYLMDKFKTFDKSVPVTDKFKCEKCDFVTDSDTD